MIKKAGAEMTKIRSSLKIMQNRYWLEPITVERQDEYTQLIISRMEYVYDFGLPWPTKL
jgi:hypothetical protein